jgi:hypothetical protein
VIPQQIYGGQALDVIPLELELMNADSMLGLNGSPGMMCVCGSSPQPYCEIGFENPEGNRVNLDPEYPSWGAPEKPFYSSPWYQFWRGCPVAQICDPEGNYPGGFGQCLKDFYPDYTTTSGGGIQVITEGASALNFKAMGLAPKKKGNVAQESTVQAFKDYLLSNYGFSNIRDFESESDFEAYVREEDYSRNDDYQNIGFAIIFNDDYPAFDYTL